MVTINQKVGESIEHDVVGLLQEKKTVFILMEDDEERSALMKGTWLDLIELVGQALFEQRPMGEVLRGGMAKYFELVEKQDEAENEE